jgi:tetratricopeptide (TPR) repeat protein/transcriptional regulator with XRE-family HTH domain
MPEDALPGRTARRRRLAERRKVLGLTQEALAGLLGVERSTVVRWERGETEPLPSMRPKLAEALRVPAGRLEGLLADPGPADPAPGLVPRQLPAAVANFTGRAAELESLNGLLDNAGATGPGTVVISAIGGTAGVGKTALALHWAHRVAGRFGDGQLYLNLRGYDPGRPVKASDALAGFLRALGTSDQDIPAGEEERAALYRSLTAGRRMLVVLDNAGSVAQVRPLLPGTAACVTVVTSRDALAGLVARDGARRVELDVLPVADAVGLLRALIGGRVDADPAGAAVLASRCCQLPLTLRVAAELAAARPAVPIAELAAELADRQHRLDLLEVGGDSRSAVRTVFSWSYQHLAADAARAFRLAGLQPALDFGPDAAAALIGTTVDHARHVLDALARASLLQTTRPGRYGMHDLLRAYARELATGYDTEQEQHVALTRLLGHYLNASATAMDILYPADQNQQPPIGDQRPSAPPLTDPAVARDWLDQERASLVAVAVHAAEHDCPELAIQLASTLSSYLHDGPYLPEAVTIHCCARQAAHRTGDRAAEAAALTELGLIEWLQDRYQQAADHHRQALTLFRDIGDRAGQAGALNALGLVGLSLGSYQQASDQFREAVTLYRQTGTFGREAHALGNLGSAEFRLGRYQQAAGLQLECLDLCRQNGDRSGEACALGRLGDVQVQLGQHEQATRCLEESLVLYRDIREPAGEATTLMRLGNLQRRLGRYDDATGHFRQALEMWREMGNQAGEADALNGLGEVLLASDQPHRAKAEHATALTKARQISDHRQQARAHDGLAHACHAAGDASAASDHWQHALALYVKADAPEAEHVRARLSSRRQLPG